MSDQKAEPVKLPIPEGFPADKFVSTQELAHHADILRKALGGDAAELANLKHYAPLYLTAIEEVLAWRPAEAAADPAPADQSGAGEEGQDPADPTEGVDASGNPATTAPAATEGSAPAATGDTAPAGE